MKKNKNNRTQILTGKNQSSINEASKKNKIPEAGIRNNNTTSEIHSSKTKLFSGDIFVSRKWFYAILILLPLVFLIALEVFLRTINYGYNFEQWIDTGEGKYVLNPDIGRKYFPNGDFTPNTIEDIFDKDKKENCFRVFVLGESSAQGFPYNPMGSFSRYIRKRLELAYPNTLVEVVNLGMTAINSYTLADLLPGVLEQKPDLILIYTGHNEYYGALGIGSVESYGSSRILIKSMLYLNDFKTTQLVRNSIQWFLSLFSSSSNKNSSGTLMSRIAKDKYIPLGSEKYNAGLKQFEENLTEILNEIKVKGIPVVVGRLVSNLKDQKPFISINTGNYKNADKIYEEAYRELKNNNPVKADSLFRKAKDFDALRFRAPDEINKIIDALGKKLNIATVPIDIIFNSVSPEGIVGDNLIVDHLHPNLLGYQIIGKSFYDCMEKQGYLPKTEDVKIPYEIQDSLTSANFVFTQLDSTIGNYLIKILKNDWPYVKQRAAKSDFQSEGFHRLLQPKDFIDSVAIYRIENKLSWIDAHFISATYYLKRDDLKEYLKYINVLINQYPSLKDIDGVLKYFFEQNKIDLADYTPKRNGIMALYIGNLDNAIRHLTEAYKADPKDESVLYNLTLAYIKKKDFNTAKTMYNKYLNTNTNHVEANKLKLQIMNHAGSN